LFASTTLNDLEYSPVLFASTTLSEQEHSTMDYSIILDFARIRKTN